MSLAGFDAEFRDLPHYIYTITARIWEGRNVELIRKYYEKKCSVYAADGMVVGAEAVIKATLETMARIPDRRLLGEDVVWKKHKKGKKENGYLSSHRIISTGTYKYDESYDRDHYESTSRDVIYRTIADCWCKNNQVVEEWLVRDQGAIARCLGYHPRDYARMKIRNRDFNAYFPGQGKNKYMPEKTTDKDALGYMERRKKAWKTKEISKIADDYHHAAKIEGPSGKTWLGKEGATRFLISYLAAIDKPYFEVQDLFACENEFGKTVAMRWSVNGTCTSKGFLSGGIHGAPICIMGISHARLVNGKIETEWVVVDEVTVWVQALDGRIDHSY